MALCKHGKVDYRGSTLADKKIQKEFEVRNKDLILSKSDYSYIIANKESYDQRQYPSWSGNKYNPGVNTPEGQAFAHILVIPIKRVFNIVDPDAIANHGELLTEMRNHFTVFWNHQKGCEKILKRIHDVVMQRNDSIDRKSETGKLYNDLVAKVKSTYEKMSEMYATLKVEDFVFAFHPFPECSIGHLHMHVFPRDDKFRTVSTTRHDKKTIPLHVILKVERGT